MNETISQILMALNQTGGIPLKVTTVNTTNWTQMIITLAVSSIFVIFFLHGIFKTKISESTIKIRLFLLKKLIKRNLILIKHTQRSLFDSSMIEQKTLQDISKAIQKFKGKPFDLILHTPGGEVFSALFISRIIKEYKNEVRTIIPMYAMSGGTLLALSTSKIFMGNTACLGCVDPQLGNLFKFGSAKSWDKILKFKGKKADDQSISFAYTGKQYTKSIRDYMNKIVNFGLSQKQKKAFIDFITSGNVEHAFPLTPNDLKAFGFKINKIPRNIMKKLIKIVSSEYGDGVIGV